MAEVTAAPIPVTLGGREYLLSPLTDRDMAEVNNWLRAQVIEIARTAMTPDMTKEEREELLSVAIRDARTIDFASGQNVDGLGSIRGIGRVIWQGMRCNHPDVTYEELVGLLIDAATVDYVMKVWTEVNVGELAKEKTRDGSPKDERPLPTRSPSTPSSPRRSSTTRTR